MKFLNYAFLILCFYSLLNCATASHERVYMASINGDEQMLKKGFGPSCWTIPLGTSCIFPFFFDFNWSPFQLFTSRGSQDVRNKEGNTALMWAVSQKNSVIIDLLLEKEAKVAIKDKYNKSVLQFALAKYGKDSETYKSLRERFEKELFCDNLYQKFRGLVGLRNCLTRSTKVGKEKLNDDELTKLAPESSGPEVDYGQIVTIPLPDKTLRESEHLEKRNMSEKRRYEEFRKVTDEYKKQGNSKKNKVSEEKFEECDLAGDLRIEEIAFINTKEGRDAFKNEYLEHIVKEDKEAKEETEEDKEDKEDKGAKDYKPGEKLLLNESPSTKRFKVFSIEDREKLIKLKRRLSNLATVIVKAYKDFFAYYDLANEKTIEQDYQKMASMNGEIALYKINNYMEKKKGLTACKLETFKNFDEYLAELKEDLSARMGDLMQRTKDDPRFALNNIKVKFQKNEPIATECKALESDPNLTKYDFRDLSSIYALCYYSLLKTNEQEAQVYYDKAFKLGNPQTISEISEIRRKHKAKEPISPPSLGTTETKIVSIEEPQSQKYQLAVLTFIDQTQNPKTESIRYTLADILTSELFITSRFDLLDRADLKQIEKIPAYLETKEQEETFREEEYEDRTGEEDYEEEEVSKSKKKKKRNRKKKKSDFIKTPREVLNKSQQEKDNIVDNHAQLDGVLMGYITSIDWEEGFLYIDYRIVNTLGIKNLEQKRKKTEEDRLAAFEKAQTAIEKAKTAVEADKTVVEAFKNDKDLSADEKNTVEFIGSLRDSIILAGTGRIKLLKDKQSNGFSLNRKDIQKIAMDIKESFADNKVIAKSLAEEAADGYYPVEYKDVEGFSKNPNEKKTVSLRVMKIEGNKIIINAGTFHGIKSGFVGYVVEPGYFNTYRYLAKFIVEQVFERSARCVVIDGKITEQKEGRSVFIK